jgi:hypothetical protein
MKKIMALVIAIALLPYAGMAMEDNTRPHALDVSIGGFGSRSYRVFLHGEALSYRGPESVNPTVKSAPIIVTVSETAWRKFRNDLNTVNVWNWPKSCQNPLIMDGTQWRVSIHYADHSIESSGSNSFPMTQGACNESPQTSDNFESFLKAIQDLTGKEFH